MKLIPVCEPLMGREESRNVIDCLSTNWISSKGKYIAEFEKEFAEFCTTRFAITATSGTSALHLALLSLGVGRGDEVIIPTFTMAATAFAVFYTQATPVLVDCEPETFNINPAKVEEKITKRTKVIMVVHLYGHPCDMAAFVRLAKKYKLFLVEDAAEAHGAEYRGQRVGSFADVSAFSFYANKIITTGEGGMVVTNSKTIARKVAILKDMAFNPAKRFIHLAVGFNYRMTNIQAAIGLGQLKKISTFIEKRRKNARLYNSLLKDVKGIGLPVERPYAKNVYWMYGITVDKEFGMSKKQLREYLSGKGIETRDFFVPVHKQPFYRQLVSDLRRERFPSAEEASRKGFYLPSGSGLDDDKIRYIVSQIKSAASLL
jgi:perosamine synthetase